MRETAGKTLACSWQPPMGSTTTLDHVSVIYSHEEKMRYCGTFTVVHVRYHANSRGTSIWINDRRLSIISHANSGFPFIFCAGYSLHVHYRGARLLIC